MPRIRKRVVRALLIALGVVGVYALYTYSTNNFHTVIAGELYRSARPTPELIAKWHKRYGIKTIINLMGAHPESDWYRAEQAAAKANGITLIDRKMSAERDVSAEELEEILSMLSNAERPILVHGRSGADRSGIVSAFYVAGVAGGSEYYSELQLTPFFGHPSASSTPTRWTGRSSAPNPVSAFRIPNRRTRHHTREKAEAQGLQPFVFLVEERIG